VVSILRRWRLLPLPRISQEEAVRVARAECERQAWPWSEPVVTHEGVAYWHFRTNADSLGGNVNVFIDARTGAVQKSAFARR
jgi:hypothetical protein